jgi:two-component system sensor histidine kinase CpxA
MNRLYWRIFLAFWLVILITVGFAITASTISFLVEMDSTRAESMRAALDAAAAPAQHALTDGGVAGLRRWLAGHQQEYPTPPLFVVTPDDRELLDRRMESPPPRRLIRRLRDEAGNRMGPELRLFPARVLTAADGARFVLLTPFRSPPPAAWFFRPENRLLVLVIALLASGSVCFFLARHLTRPIGALRKTGLLIAEGDLSARIGDGVPKRRDEFGALARDFNRMADRVQALMFARQQLLRDVSHELRSPLARLQAAVGLARQRGGSGAERELDRIELEADRLNELIGRVLSFTRLESMDSIARSPVDVAEIVENVVEDARYEAAPAGKEVLLDDFPEARLGADEDLLRSAVENVVRNAVEHCRKTVRVGLARDPSAEGFLITVTDDGPGVASEHLGRLFEPFFTAPRDEAGPSAHRGSGLGLSIARRAIELHGGSASVENRPGGGLRVDLRVPVG